MEMKSARGNGSGQMELEVHVAFFRNKMAFKGLKKPGQKILV
jgi:hypothetical protein